MKEKKILFIYYQNIKAGGVAKVTTTLVNELIEMGYIIDILFLMKEHHDFYPLDPRIKKHYLDSFSLWTWRLCEFNNKYLKFIPKIQNFNTYIYHYGIAILMNRWLRKNQSEYHTIVSCWYKLSCILALNKTVCHKSVSWEHISHLVGGKFWNTLKTRYNNLREVICINNDDYKYFKKINPKTHIIGNIMDPEFEKQKFRSFQEKENIISLVARLDPEKNILEFLEIIKETNLPADWKVNIIGQGLQLDLLKDYAEKNALHQVNFLGQVDSKVVRDYMSKSKILCLTSIREGFGIVLVEGMFASNVLIAYDCPSGPADIINEKNGYLIPLHAKESFVEKLNYLVNNPSVLEKKIKTSFLESAKWKRENIIKSWEKVL
ncbi:glycosyltransferase [Epilithonimonas sp. UC225_85]|uniref:glycosyltransferase n=1 Tax=Epilithonimonas sp. UC225_85 TaxID=3350167 RepID=UPI0036D2659F